MNSLKLMAWSLVALLLSGSWLCAGEADLVLPDFWNSHFDIFGMNVNCGVLLLVGSFVICGTLGISLYQLWEIHKQPAHKSMLAISEIIFQTCKTYLIQQGKFLLMLFVIIAVLMAYYFLALKEQNLDTLLYVLGF